MLVDIGIVTQSTREFSRKSYTLRHKRLTVHGVENHVASGMSIKEACALERVERRVFYRWKKTLNLLKDNDDAAGETRESEQVKKTYHGHLRSLHHGRVSMLAPKKMQLLRWIFEQREQGVQVTSRAVRKVAERMIPELREKTISAREQIVRRFMKSAGLTHRLGTHTAQQSPKVMEQAARDFMALMRQKVAHMNPDHVLNMDQTPIPFSYHNKRTWDEKGVKTVHTRSSTSDTKRATLAATISMSGEVLPPLLIFKGEKNGRIEKKELPNLPPMCLYAVQKKAWMDESMMLLWIEQCLSPWKATLPPHTVPLLILDSFRVHMMGPIVTKIQSLGIEVQHIPGGCTYLCQPIDIGVNKPIKKALAEHWEDWADTEGIGEGREMKTPSRELISSWVGEAYWTLKTKTCENAWKKKGYEWKM